MCPLQCPVSETGMATVLPEGPPASWLLLTLLTLPLPQWQVLFLILILILILILRRTFNTLAQVRGYNRQQRKENCNKVFEKEVENKLEMIQENQEWQSPPQKKFLARHKGLEAALKRMQ